MFPKEKKNPFNATHLMDEKFHNHDYEIYLPLN